MIAVIRGDKKKDPDRGRKPFFFLLSLYGPEDKKKDPDRGRKQMRYKIFRH